MVVRWSCTKEGGFTDGRREVNRRQLEYVVKIAELDLHRDGWGASVKIEKRKKLTFCFSSFALAFLPLR